MIKTKFIHIVASFLILTTSYSFAADSTSSDEEFIELVNTFELMGGAEQGFEIIQAADFAWDLNSTELQQIVIYGDPSEEGLYILRGRFPAGVTSIPHTHNQDRFVSVIEGVWYAGTDASYDINQTTRIPAGGYMVHPAGAVHFDGANHEAPVIVEIRGMGPVVTETVPITPAP
ncbi:MAG: cupin domain-containing protein [Gammaproteobacteria bacterium]|jgi:quercetin dioxygenase-like cupin family protein|nr:cupin domain-containing protein [Gammaproteobacteria bacterium]